MREKERERERESERERERPFGKISVQEMGDGDAAYGSCEVLYKCY